MKSSLARPVFNPTLAACALALACASALAATAHAQAVATPPASVPLATAAAPAQPTSAEAAAAAAATKAIDAVKQTYDPRVGQSGKDVMWVPTSDTVVAQMLRMAAITPQDYLVDLGSGDGRTVITAALRGTRAKGIEYNPELVELSNKAAKEAGVADKATFAKADLFETDFSDATVVTMFLLPDINIRLRPKLLEMKPGTRIVSNSFDMGDWAADETAEVTDKCRTYCHAYKWIVPAKAGGTWMLNDKQALDLNQQYQKLSGHLADGSTQHPVTEASLNGAQISFTANGRKFKGEVKGDVMQGTDDTGAAWTAKRKS